MILVILVIFVVFVISGPEPWRRRTPAAGGPALNAQRAMSNPQQGDTGHSTPEARASGGRWAGAVWQVLGLAFCAIWAAAVVAFPAVKKVLSGYAPVALGAVAGLVLWLRPVRAAINRRLEGPSPGRFLAGVLAAALVLRVGAIFLFPVEPKGDPGFFHENAVKLVTGQEYGDPGRRAHYPPGMSLMLAGLYLLTGPNVWAAKGLNILLGVGMVWLIYDLGRMALSPLAARWAAVLTAVMPTLVFFSVSLGYEILLGCIFLAVCELVIRSRRGGLAGVGMAALTGLLLGFGTLVKPICLLVPLICLVGWLTPGAGRRRPQKALLYLLVSVVLMAGAIAPWTVRNYRAFGRFVLISTNGGEVLYAANHPGASGLYATHRKLPGETDELSRDRLGRQAALQWIRRNPGDFLRLAVRKAVFTWGTSSTVVAILSTDRMSPGPENACKAIVNVFWAMLVVLCVGGAFTTPARKVWANPLLGPLHLLLFYVFALHSVFEALSRHHIPVLGSLLLLAGAGLASGEITRVTKLTKATRKERVFPS